MFVRAVLAAFVSVLGLSLSTGISSAAQSSSDGVQTRYCEVATRGSVPFIPEDGSRPVQLPANDALWADIDQPTLGHEFWRAYSYRVQKWGRISWNALRVVRC